MSFKTRAARVALPAWLLQFKRLKGATPAPPPHLFKFRLDQLPSLRATPPSPPSKNTPAADRPHPLFPFCSYPGHLTGRHDPPRLRAYRRFGGPSRVPAECLRRPHPPPPPTLSSRPLAPWAGGRTGLSRSASSRRAWPRSPHVSRPTATPHPHHRCPSCA